MCAYIYIYTHIYTFGEKRKKYIYIYTYIYLYITFFVAFSTLIFEGMFFVVDLKWWRSDELHSYFSHLDSTGGFYRYRWGDACVQFLMAAIFLERETEVTRFSNLFPYWHQGSVIDPERKGFFSFGEY